MATRPNGGSIGKRWPTACSPSVAWPTASTVVRCRAPIRDSEQPAPSASCRKRSASRPRSSSGNCVRSPWTRPNKPLPSTYRRSSRRVTQARPSSSPSTSAPVVVHSDAKAGRDAGELCGISPVGVVATQDPAAMLAGDADAVVYAAGANLRPLEAIADMASILRAGKNVVSCSVVPLVFPDALDSAFTDPLREAALEGGASFFTTGIDSGFANDVLPLVLSGVSRVIESIRVTELFNYATYPDQAAVYEILGFGKPRS